MSINDILAAETRTDGPQWSKKTVDESEAVRPAAHCNIMSWGRFQSNYPHSQFVKSHNANLAVFLNSFGVAAGSATIKAMQNLENFQPYEREGGETSYKTFKIMYTVCRRARARVPKQHTIA